MFPLSTGGARRGLRIVAALACLTLLTLTPTGASASVPPPGADLPSCRYRDVQTRYTSTMAWRKTLLDPTLKVSRHYVPPDLVSVGRAGIGGSGQIRKVVVYDLHAMAAAARRAGASISVTSAYRSYAHQRTTFKGWVARDGYHAALLESARPGHSEHQLGTTIDFRSAGSSREPWDYADWGTSQAGRWMGNHAWEYGFVMSYPAGRTRVTCYRYEPWHFRYVGRDLAADVHDSGMVLRRYLWRNFETAPAG